MKKRIVALLLAMVLVLGCGIGGTLAWLLNVDGEVKNTFTTSDVDIELEESDSADEDTDADVNAYKMIPGYTITKDPKVTVNSGSEACFVFIKVEESANYDDFMEYTIAEGWTKLEGEEKDSEAETYVYYREVLSPTENIQILADDLVEVKDTVTKEMMNGLIEDTYPTLDFTAYASQLYKTNEIGAANDGKFEPLEAWNLVKDMEPAETTP